MNRQIMLSFGELYTKGKNRKTFIGQLKGNIKLETDGMKIWHKNENGLTYIGRLLNGTYPNLENIYNSINIR